MKREHVILDLMGATDPLDREKVYGQLEVDFGRGYAEGVRQAVEGHHRQLAAEAQKRREQNGPVLVR